MRYLLLLFGVFCCSTAVILIKLTTVDPVLLAALRLLGATIVLLPVFFRVKRRYVGAFTREHLRRCILPGIFLGLHFVSWIIGARLTWAANSSLIVNLVPVVMPFFLFFVIKERITRGELIGTAIAIIGVLLLGWESYELDPALLIGDLVCAGSMLLFAGYLMFARKNSNFPNLWLYVIPVYGIAGVSCLLLVPILGDISKPVPSVDWLYIVVLVLIPTILGHSILTWGMKHLRSQLVAILNLAQFIFAGILAAIFLGEIPGGLFVIAALLVVVGSITAILTQPKRIPGN